MKIMHALWPLCFLCILILQSPGCQQSKAELVHQQEFEFTRSLVGFLAGEDVLEIGFGLGEFIPLFLDADVASYTHIDCSLSNIEIAQDYFEDPRLRLFQMGATELDAEGAFDLVVMCDTIEHIPVYEMAVVWSKIRRALRPGGYIVISTPIYNNPNAPDHSDETSSVSGMHYHKQTWGSLIRACLRHNLTIARTTKERMLALVRTEDLPLFDQKKRAAHLEAQSALLARCGVTNFDGQLTPVIERMLVPGAGRVAMGCVAEDNVKSLSQALRLLQSVRWFGGCMAGVNFFVCVVNSVDPYYAREFERLGAFVRIVSPFSSLHPPSNKLRLLNLPETGAYDTMMLLDCDTVIVQDPWRFLDGESFQARLAELPTVSPNVFQRLFEHFDLELPEQDYQRNPEGAPKVWYCDTGVLVFPQQTLLTLGAAWHRYNTALLGRLDLLGSHSFFCEQASLSLAFSAQPTPFRELPLSMNFPSHPLHTTAAIQACDPIILRYDDRVDASDYLQPSPNPGAQKRISQFNEQLRQARRQRFDNRLFWDFRYTHDPTLGSGLGSHDNALAFKQELLHRLVETLQPQSILDVGCGDQAVSRSLPDDIYTGVDISPVVIERNQAAYPNRQFICGDVLDLDLHQADLVICLDVLIHIDSPDSYRAIVNRLVALTDKIGIVSGYEAPPDIEHSITFYHEPLSETLSRAGARHLRQIGAYRKVTVWTFEPPEATQAASVSDSTAGILRKLN